jgi:putative aldouronate transport system permease protein
MMVNSAAKRVGDWVVVVFCVVVMVLCLFPMLNIFARSLSGEQALILRRVSFIPVDFTWDNYKFVFGDPAFSRSMLWTTILTAIYTVVSLFLTTLCAFPMIYNMKGKKFLNALMIFTMYFNAGIIPNYILMQNLHLLDNPLVLILPGAISVFNMIILRSFFYNVPDSLRESAELDGANPFVVLTKIYLPLSLPVLATLALFYAVGRWNGFSDALMFLPQSREFHPIQLLLYNIIKNLSSIDVAAQEGLAGNVPVASEGMTAAAIMFATVPILVVYPWLQRYFIAGVTIGAVKG